MLSFKTEVFEGPLELLLSLINKNQVDIYDIPISLITKQFIEEVDKMDKDAETIGEFITMTATLIGIKAKMLLPKDEQEAQDDSDPREELVKRLIEYKKFKNAAMELKIKDENADEEIFRHEDSRIMQQIKTAVPPDVNELLEGITMEYLYDIFENILKRVEKKKDKRRSEFKEIKKSVYNLKDKMQYIKDLIFIGKQIIFSEIFTQDTSKAEVIVTFLAVLELVKEKQVRIMQESGEIFVLEVGISDADE